MDYPKLIVSNQKEESISIQRVKYTFEASAEAIWTQFWLGFVMFASMIKSRNIYSRCKKQMIF